MNHHLMIVASSHRKQIMGYSAPELFLVASAGTDYAPTRHNYGAFAIRQINRNIGLCG